MRASRIAAIAVAAVMASTVSACTVSASIDSGSEDAVPASEVEAQGAEALAAATGDSTVALDCDDDLPAEEGSTITCDLSSANGPFDVEVTSTGRNGDVVDMDFVVVEDAG